MLNYDVAEEIPSSPTERFTVFTRVRRLECVRRLPTYFNFIGFLLEYTGLRWALMAVESELRTSISVFPHL